MAALCSDAVCASGSGLEAPLCSLGRVKKGRLQFGEEKELALARLLLIQTYLIPGCTQNADNIFIQYNNCEHTYLLVVALISSRATTTPSFKKQHLGLTI